jgi:hypothetical protein
MNRPSARGDSSARYSLQQATSNDGFFKLTLIKEIMKTHVIYHKVFLKKKN